MDRKPLPSQDESSSDSRLRRTNRGSSRSRHGDRSKDEKRKRKKDRRRKKRRRDSSSDSSSRPRRRSKEKREKRRPPSDRPASAEGPPGAHALAASLCSLFDSYPAMASLSEGGLPLLLARLSSGAEIDLRSVPDGNLAGLLGGVFDSLRIHGLTREGGSWSWRPGGSEPGDETALPRSVRALLGGIGVAADAFEERERSRRREHARRFEERGSPRRSDEETLREKRVERLTSQLLSRFDPRSPSDSTSALAAELRSVVRSLREGGCVRLDGIEDDKLRAGLGQLFRLAGLEFGEMDDEEAAGEEEDNEQHAAEKSYGYSLPENDSSVSSNLDVMLRVCQFRSSDGAEGAPISWAAKRPPPTEESSDEEDGPAPLGTLAAVRQSKRQRAAAAATAESAGADAGREEWMTTPGRRDFLRGIQSGLKSRTFKNERNRGRPVSSAPAEQIDPQVLAEVRAIQSLYEESRGPSLLDAHRQNQATANRQKGKEEWKWNREKNLDDGRRVDKNALSLVLGGAKTELRSKFSSGR